MSELETITMILNDFIDETNICDNKMKLKNNS